MPKKPTYEELEGRVQELEKAIKNLHSDEEHFRKLYEQIPLGYHSLDSEGCILEVNKTWLDLMGYDRSEVIGHWFGEFLVSSEIALFEERFSKFVSDGVVHTALQMVKRDGSRITVHVEGRIGYDDGGRFQQTHCMVYDITERKNTQALRTFLARAANMLLDANAPASVVQVLCKEAQTLLKCQVYINCIRDAATGNLKINAACGFSDEQARRMAGLEEETSLCGDATAQAHRLFTEDVPLPHDKWTEQVRNLDVKAYACHPLLCKGELLGTLSFGTRTRARFSVEELAFMKSLADIVAMALRRSRVEDELRASEDKFRNLFNNAQVGMFRSKLDGSELLDLNDRFLEIFGGTREQILGTRTDTYWVDPHEREEMVRRLEAEGRVTDYEFALFNTRGETRRCLTSLRVYRKEGILEGSVIDITDRKRMEENLEESRQRLKTILDTVNTGIIIIDPDTHTIVDVNPFGAEMIGASQDEILGKICHGYICHAERGRCPVTDLHEEIHNSEQVLLTAQGVEIPILKTVKMVPIGGKPMILSTFTDIREFKQAQAERMHLEQRIKQIQRIEAIGELAGGIAHDFNNLLYPITGFSEMLLEDLEAGSTARENALEIYNAAKRGSELVKQILFFSRQAEHKKMPIRIQKVVSEALKLARSTIPSDISITQSLQNNCHPVIADPTQIHQVVLNLITNAFHAVEQEGGEITLQLKETDLSESDASGTLLSPGRYVVLTISDTGNGIEPEVMGKIFEPYFTTKEPGKGTGLGLAVVYGIVRDHEGDIRVFSRPGQGAAFHVYLPLMGPTMSAEDDANAAGAIAAGNERILLIDDEITIVRMAKQILERLGYRVIEKTSSTEALEAFQAAPETFDLVITDMTMPKMTGDQLARILISIHPKIPIILCTGFSEKMTPEKAAEIGIKGFLMKPILKAQLAQVVRKALDERKQLDRP